MIPGMGIEEEMMPPDAIKDEPDDDTSFQFGSATGGQNGEGGAGASIPGFDIPADGGVEEDKSKKKPFAKPIPKQFQQQWNEVRNVLPAPVPPLSPTGGSDVRKNVADDEGDD